MKNTQKIWNQQNFDVNFTYLFTSIYSKVSQGYHLKSELYMYVHIQVLVGTY